jgi:L-lactate dehydrogenase
MVQTERIAVIGAGHVGATTAFALMLRALFSEIVLVDSNAALAEAEAADIADANALARPTRIWAGSYADAASARIAVITAGAATHGEESRLAVASRSADIVADCVLSLRTAGFAGILLVAANPVDLMSHTAFRHADLPATKVIGTGTLLDSSRLRQTLAQRFAVAPASVQATVLGEHGDSEVAAFTLTRIGGIPAEQFPGGAATDLAAVAREVRDAGYQIIAGKGYTSFGIATAIVRICEAIVRDEQVILPVSTLLTGQYGVDNLYLSLPCVIGAAGIVRVLEPELSPGERDALLTSARILGAAASALHDRPLPGVAGGPGAGLDAQADAKWPPDFLAASATA